MFNVNEKTLILTALDQSIASQKRGQNTTKNPEFKVLYEKLETELHTLKAKIQGIEPMKR